MRSRVVEFIFLALIVATGYAVEEETYRVIIKFGVFAVVST